MRQSFRYNGRVMELNPRSCWATLLKQSALLAVGFLLLYLPFLSINYDPNGIAEAGYLEGGVLVSPNHIIYRPVGAAVYWAAEALGYHGRPLYVLQVLNAFCGAAGVGLAFLAFRKLGARPWAALAASVLWGTSFIYWFFSTDVSYVTMAGVFMAAAILCRGVLIESRSHRAAAGLGISCALAALSWQAAIFAFPLAVWSLRRRARELGLAVAAWIVLLGGSYAALGFLHGYKSPAALMRWSLNYGGDRLPEFGHFEPERLALAGEAAVRSFQFDAFERGREFIERPRPHRVRQSAGAICLAALALFTAAISLRSIIGRDPRLIWALAAYLVWWPFLVWWSPGESKWFLVPNLFLCAAAAIVWSSSIVRMPAKILIGAAIAVMAQKTFASRVLTHHRDAGAIMRKADCIARNVSPADVVIAPDWTWAYQVSYFHHIEPVNIIGGDRDDALRARLATEVTRGRERGAQIFIVDPSSYSPAHLEWLAAQTGFSLHDFDRFPGHIAFQCEDAKFREVSRLVNR